MKKITLALLLTVFWLLLSGYYQPLMLFFMVCSVAVVVFITHRMMSDYFDVNPITRVDKLLSFSFWFVGEIVKANIDVAKMVWTGQGVKPSIREVKCSQKSQVGKVLHANAIILTPGTLSMEIDEDKGTIVVHALNSKMLDELEEGELDKRICQLEGE